MIFLVVYRIILFYFKDLERGNFFIIKMDLFEILGVIFVLNVAKRNQRACGNKGKCRLDWIVGVHWLLLNSVIDFEGIACPQLYIVQTRENSDFSLVRHYLWSIIWSTSKEWISCLFASFSCVKTHPLYIWLQNSAGCSVLTLYCSQLTFPSEQKPNRK